MVTVDRLPESPNFLGDTLSNLLRSDLATCQRLHSLTVVDSASFWWARAIGQQLGVPEHVTFTGPENGRRRCGNLNVAAALSHGYDTGAEWVVFLEDDIDVCARFFESVGAWLDDWADLTKRHVYSLGANYPESAVCRPTGAWWYYPIRAFYGTQGFVLHRDDALSLSIWLDREPFARNREGTAWDLIMHAWARHHWPSIEHFAATSPAFVQHIGKTSLVNPRANVHTFPSWPGRDWFYAGRERQVAQ